MSDHAASPSAAIPSGDLRVSLPAEWIDAVAEPAAAILVERQAPAVDEGFLDVAGAAAFLACPTSRIYSLVSARRLPHHRDGSRLPFDRAELRAYLADGGAVRL